MTGRDVVIVGGGFAGMCAARALGERGRRVVVLEARTGADPRFRGELMHPPAVEILDALRLLAPLRRAGGVDVDGFAVVLDAGRPAITLPYAEMARAGAPRALARGFAISHPDMVACFRREVSRDPGVALRTGVRVAELIEEGGAVGGVRTADGEEIRAPLTVVADGRHSKLRRALDIPESTRLLSYTAAVLVEGAALPCEGHGHVFHGSFGPILAYPIGEGRVRMCIDLPIDTGKGREAVAAFLRTECARSVPEPLRSGLLRALAVEAPEICANHSITTRRCTAPGVALVGDSGGCSHPITAAGMMIALHDIRTLAAEIDRGGDLASALARYQAQRYAFVRAREILAEGLYDVFRRGDDGARALRSGLFRYWTSGPRARAASMSLLSGRESGLGAFMAEFVSVVGESALSVLDGADDTALAGGRGAAARGLLRTAYDQLRRTAALVYVDARRRPVLDAPARLGALTERVTRRARGETEGAERAAATPPSGP